MMTDLEISLMQLEQVVLILISKRTLPEPLMLVKIIGPFNLIRSSSELDENIVSQITNNGSDLLSYVFRRCRYLKLCITVIMKCTVCGIS